MPIMDGLEAVRLIRAWEKKTGSSFLTPILAFTGGVTDKEIKDCMESGCDGYISKPVERDKLLAAIQEHLRNGNSSRGVKPPAQAS